MKADDLVLGFVCIIESKCSCFQYFWSKTKLIFEVVLNVSNFFVFAKVFNLIVFFFIKLYIGFVCFLYFVKIVIFYSKNVMLSCVFFYVYCNFGYFTFCLLSDIFLPAKWLYAYLDLLLGEGRVYWFFIILLFLFVMWAIFILC